MAVRALRVVNLIPASLSGESGQDSEPNLAVDPQNPQRMVATAFTRDPLGGPQAPVFLSSDGGRTWQVRSIVPGGSSTADISVGFGDTGGTLFAGILRRDNVHLNVLRAANPFTTTTMTVLLDRASEDQPWVTGGTVGGRDRVFIGHNDFNVGPRSASVVSSLDARTAAAPAGLVTRQVERRTTAGQNGPPVRTAVHPDGTAYAAFQRWTSASSSSAGTDVTMDIVVVRGDPAAAVIGSYADLTAADGLAGTAVAAGRFVRFTSSTGPLGQERIGADLSIAVDATDSDVVYVAWCDRVGGAAGTDWTMHVRRSLDRGHTWSADLRTVTNAKNPALAVNARGHAGLLLQQLTGTGAAARWTTRLEVTRNGWATTDLNAVLHTALAAAPPRAFLPYLGDYVRLLSVGNDFYGVFSGSNLPAPANFPSGVRYQRNADFTSQRLLAVDGITPVAVSIDPFFVHYAEPDNLPWAPSLL
ncbi:hypothetical protein [Mangrovihabitans endophyticus]|uniref:Exo-alpha-sialidase n=1 Tax=Mangrovihabitans endophyticus TaxID=1751298 RepID=A0A8J3BX28_9ACTN|nr:hypothetical protein [Mangrovihabitans endophyticus]GGK76417.1 hypothetical protein GCM10012284_07950 [Mangrovihabitans endophyticus]